MSISKHQKIEFTCAKKLLWLVLTASPLSSFLHSYDSWLDEAKENKKNNKKSREEPEGGGDDGSVVSMTEEETTTTTSSSKKRFTAAVKGAGKHKGWSDEGIQLYNLLERKLEEQRDSPALNTFESELKEMFLNNGKGRIASKSKEKREMAGNNFERKRRRMEQNGIDSYDSYSSVVDNDDDDEDMGQRAAL